MRSSWCLSYYVQLFSYNFKLCVFLFAPFGIHKTSTQISFPNDKFLSLKELKKVETSSLYVIQ